MSNDFLHDNEFLHDAVSRRTFLARMTAVGLGTAAAALIAGCGGGSNGGGSTTPGTGLTSFADQKNFPGIPGANENVVVLNYALTLETLEADLYRQALNIAAGLPIATALPAGNASSYSLAVSPGSLTSQEAAAGFLYLQQYAYVEAAHRDFLRAFIPTQGGTPVPANPKGYSAVAAGLVLGATMQAILGVILTAEETGVSAYLGAAGFLTNQTLVQAASTIYSTESRHSAVINLTLGNISANATAAPGPSGAFGGVQPLANAVTTGISVLPGTAEFAKTPTQVLAAIKPFFVM
ncbi:MAG: ferritin-like domain-containing protein [Janthinobacterium lividum]